MRSSPSVACRREGASLALGAGLAVAVFVAALLPRVENAGRAFRDGWLQVAPFDELYQARRVLLAADGPALLLAPDPLRGVHGAFCPWPPLYQLVAGQAARLSGARGTRDVLARVAWIPPLVSSLAAAGLAWALARKTSAATGLLAGLGMAWTPTLVAVSRVGAIDHHFLEGPLVLGILAALVPLAGVDASPRTRSGLLLAGALLLALLVQTALVLYAGAALLVVLVTLRGEPAALRAAAAGFAAAGGGLLAFRAAQPAGYPESAWFLGTPHAALLLAAALACLAASAARGLGAGPVAAPVAGALLAGLALAAVPGVVPALVEGSGFLGGSAWFRAIQEFRPLFAGGPRTWLDDLAFLGGGSLLALPLVALARRDQSGPRLAAGLFATLALAAAVTRARMTVIAAPAGALAAALLYDALRRRGRPLVGLGLALASLLPGAAGTLALVRAHAAQIPSGAAPYLAAAQALRGLPGPEGAVLGPWGWGHALGVGSGRRVLVDNFGLIGDRTLFEDAVAAPFLAGEEALALLCDRTGTRFVVLNDLLSAVTTQLSIGGRPPEAYLVPSRDGGPPRPTRLLEASFWFRAQMGPWAGGAPGVPSPFRGFRLAAVTGGGPAPRVQVWERVRAGAFPR